MKFYLEKFKGYFTLAYPSKLALREPTKSSALISTGTWFSSLVTHIVTPS